MSEKKLLQSVESIEDLMAYLEMKGRNHQSYYHYTTWDSFEKIYTNRSFLLTRGNSLSINDQHEALMKGSWREWNRTYIGSFSFGAAENMAMWGLYGLPWEDAVRIEIPREAMNAWISNVRSVIPWGIDENDSIPAEVHLADIIYVSGRTEDKKIQLYHRDKSIGISQGHALKNVSREAIMTGYIKNCAWHYENEVRVIVKLPYGSKSIEKIMLSIPESTIEKISVLTGPSFIYQRSPLYKKLQDKGMLHESDFKNLVKYRPICDMCSHRKFERRTKR